MTLAAAALSLRAPNNGALVFNRASGAPNNFILTNAVSGSGTLSQSGANIISISSANSYTGATNINSGTLRVTANDALGTSAAGTTVNSGGTLLLSGANYSTAEALSINGTGVGGNGALRNNFGSSTYAGQVTVSSNATINVTGIGESLTLTGGVVKNGTTLTIKGSGSVIVNGTGISGASANSDLVIDGGTLVTSVASTYNGPTTVQNTGTLIANNASGSATGTGSVTISSNSTLSGTGAIDAGAGNFITVNGTLQVGDSTLGSPVASSFTLTTSGGGSTVLGSSSTLKFDLFSRGGDLSGNSSAADYIRLFGPLDATAGGTLMIASNGLSGFALGDKWKLFEVTGPGTISGMLNLDYSSLGLGPALSASFDNDTGIFSVVPEPSRMVLLFMGTFGVMLRRRRR
ncbi:MAG: PEP-CTERM sorting domain-containing protein [Verrucomicrobia bacterium]|nr:PEP-CTERM sorting domain-containing protein [Verrucomicrobiota bacterium]